MTTEIPDGIKRMLEDEEEDRLTREMGEKKLHETKFIYGAVCPDCGGLDAGMDKDGNVLCYSCGYMTAEEIREYKERKI